MAQKPKQYELVMWEDPASNFDGWQDIEGLNAKSLSIVYSVGWPVKETEHFLYLAMDWCKEEANTIGEIPISGIKARKVINLRGFPPKEKKKPFLDIVGTFGVVPPEVEGEVEMFKK